VTDPRATREPFAAETFRVADAADLRVVLTRLQRTALTAGATPNDHAVLATIVSELGTNIYKYAQRGRIRLVRDVTGTRPHIDVWAEDDGPGIRDLSLAMQDHFSTGRSLGLGLPGVQRLADAFEIESTTSGTRVRARKYFGTSARPTNARPVSWSPNATEAAVPSSAYAHATWSGFEAALWGRPLAPYLYGGDIASWLPCDGGLLLAIADATGHGDTAYRVAEQLPGLLARFATSDLGALLHQLNAALQGTVGAAIGVLFLEPEARQFRYAGVGNTGIVRLVGGAWRGVSRDGVVGLRMPSVFEQRGSLNQGDRFVLWTDGVAGHAISPSTFSSGISSAEEVARDIVTKQGRTHDDALAVVVGWPR
jgi:anti-sigma regulatory factor (Ser/Thr protein kinase)